MNDDESMREPRRAADLEHLLRNLLAVIRTQGEVAEVLGTDSAYRDAFGYVARAADQSERRLSNEVGGAGGDG